jgi:hypothetical protein
LLADGLAAESYLDTGDRATFANGGCWGRVSCPPYVAHEMSETFVACSGGRGCVEHECYGRCM